MALTAAAPGLWRKFTAGLLAIALACGVGIGFGAGAAMAADGDDVLAVPVEGVTRSQLRDTFLQRRGGHAHEAIDISAPRGSKVFAVADGTLVKLFNSVRGGLTLYQLDRQQRRYFYYAHLDRYASGLREGMALRRCDLLGYVGSTGNAAADAPHLHFAIFEANAEKQWWKGVALNPYPLLNAAPAVAAVDC